MKLSNLFIGLIFFCIAHIFTFYQLNGQFLKTTDWFKKNEFIVAAFGIVLSFFYIWGDKIYGSWNGWVIMACSIYWFWDWNGILCHIS